MLRSKNASAFTINAQETHKDLNRVRQSHDSVIPFENMTVMNWLTIQLLCQVFMTKPTSN